MSLRTELMILGEEYPPDLDFSALPGIIVGMAWDLMHLQIMNGRKKWILYSLQYHNNDLILHHLVTATLDCVFDRLLSISLVDAKVRGNYMNLQLW